MSNQGAWLLLNHWLVLSEAHVGRQDAGVQVLLSCVDLVLRWHSDCWLSSLWLLNVLTAQPLEVRHQLTGFFIWSYLLAEHCNPSAVLLQIRLDCALLRAAYSKMRVFGCLQELILLTLWQFSLYWFVLHALRVLVELQSFWLLIL